MWRVVIILGLNTKQIVYVVPVCRRDKLALLDSQESFNQQRAQLSQENDRLLRKLEDLERWWPIQGRHTNAHSLMAVSRSFTSPSSPWQSDLQLAPF